MTVASISKNFVLLTSDKWMQTLSVHDLRHYCVRTDHSTVLCKMRMVKLSLFSKIEVYGSLEHFTIKTNTTLDLIINCPNGTKHDQMDPGHLNMTLHYNCSLLNNYFTIESLPEYHQFSLLLDSPHYDLKNISSVPPN